MSDYKPATANYDNSLTEDLGWLPTVFECLQPNPKYSWERRGPKPEPKAWPIMVPRSGPPIDDLPTLIQKMVKATWKFAEPSAGATRGNITIGVRDGAHTSSTDTYHSQVRPIKANLVTTLGNKDAIASDWKVFEQIKRTNAVTFRGDSRSPHEVITRCHGFNPPNSRTDKYYLENNIYEAFKDYLDRRYQRALTQDEFLQAVNNTAPFPQSQKLLVDYMMWRKICEKEGVHLGRMVENECLKGYISTARGVDTASRFGTRYDTVDGWVYVTVVHSGFEVPWGYANLWGTEEGEIAQWGGIPGDRIVGFVRVEPYDGPKRGSPIFMRRHFRISEPQAFEFVFNAMSGMTPNQSTHK